jgi:maleylpyruvate isomerase
MKLYTFFRSGTSHRLRIALNLKNLKVDHIPVDLRTEEHLTAEYKAIHPQGFVPALKTSDQLLIQSPAILEWLEETYPNPALLPKDPFDRAHVRAIAALIGCDIHPLNNRRVLEHLRKSLVIDEDEINSWCQKWITNGFDALEAILMPTFNPGQFCFGASPTLADVYLVPQVESAKRFKVNLNQWPVIKAIDEKCLTLEAFSSAAPAVQPDA